MPRYLLAVAKRATIPVERATVSSFCLAWLLHINRATLKVKRATLNFASLARLLHSNVPRLALIVLLSPAWILHGNVLLSAWNVLPFKSRSSLDPRINSCLCLDSPVNY